MKKVDAQRWKEQAGERRVWSAHPIHDIISRGAAAALLTEQHTGIEPGEYRMKHNLTLTITSLLSILLMTLHVTSDTVHARPGTPEAGGSTLVAVPILVIWLYGTLVLAGRRSGYVIILVMSLLSSGIPVIHMTGKRGITAGIPLSTGAFFFVWTLFALGITAAFSVVLSVRGLWSLRRQRRTAVAGSVMR